MGHIVTTHKSKAQQRLSLRKIDQRTLMKFDKILLKIRNRTRIFYVTTTHRNGYYFLAKSANTTHLMTIQFNNINNKF